MSDVVFRCPGCEKNLCAGDDSVGASLQCPDCDHQFTVPDADLAVNCASCGTEIRASSALAGEVFDCPSCGKSFTVPADVKPDAPRADVKMATITCPSCAVELEVEADQLKEMAGQSLDCPECSGKIPVPAASHRKLSVAASGVLVSASAAARTASSCPECHAALAKDAVLCTGCGFDLRTGKRHSSESGESGKLAVKAAEPATGVNDLNPMLSRYALPQAVEKTKLEKMMPYLKIGGGILGLAVVGVLVWLFVDVRGLMGDKKPAKRPVSTKPAGAVKAPTNTAASATNKQPATVTAAPGAKTVTNAVVEAADLKNVKSIIDSVETMRKTPGDASAMQELSGYIRNLIETNDTRSVKAGVMAVFALGQLGKGNESSGLAGCALIKKNYPTSEFAGLVSRENFYDPCSKCSQTGKETQKCDACDGRGICKACAGRGAKPETKVVKGVNTVTSIPCNACYKTGKCQACRGVGSFSVKCRNCAGTGKILVKTKLKIMYDLAITKTLALLAETVKSGVDLIITAGGGGAADTGAATSGAPASAAASSTDSNAVPAKPESAPVQGK